jgi:hypothetical protein
MAFLRLLWIERARQRLIASQQSTQGLAFLAKRPGERKPFSGDRSEDAIRPFGLVAKASSRAYRQTGCIAATERANV